MSLVSTLSTVLFGLKPGVAVLSAYSAGFDSVGGGVIVVGFGVILGGSSGNINNSTVTGVSSHVVDAPGKKRGVVTVNHNFSPVGHTIREGGSLADERTVSIVVVTAT